MPRAVSIDPTVLEGCKDDDNSLAVYAFAFDVAISMLDEEMRSHPEKFGASDCCARHAEYPAFNVDGSIVMASTFLGYIDGSNDEVWRPVLYFSLICNKEEPAVKMRDLAIEYIKKLDFTTLRNEAAKKLKYLEEYRNKPTKCLPADIRQFYGLD